MEEQYRVPPISFSKLPLATAPWQAEVDSRSSPDLDSLLRRSATSDSTHDDVSRLDVQYLDLVFKFQSLLKKGRDWAALGAPSTKSDVFSSLQTALVDLRVWAYDLSDDTDSFLECLRNLSSRTYDLNASLQRILKNISNLVASIEDEVDNNEEVRPMFVTLLAWRESCAHQPLESRSLNNYWINARGYAVLSKF